MQESRAVTAAMQANLSAAVHGRRPSGFDSVLAAHPVNRNTTVKLYRAGNQVGGWNTCQATSRSYSSMDRASTISSIPTPAFSRRDISRLQNQSGSRPAVSTPQ